VVDAQISQTTPSRPPQQIRYGFIIAGYVFAVFVAAFVTLTVFFLVGLFKSTNGSNIAGALLTIFAALHLGAAITAFYGFPGWLSFISFGLWKRVSAKSFYICAGGLNAIIAVSIFTFFDSPFSARPGTNFRLPSFDDLAGMYGPCVIGGLAGGYVYWLIAGRHSRTWRKPN
jgi:hypothetical protein